MQAVPRHNKTEAITPGEYLFTADDFQQIATLIKDASGISLTESKVSLVYSRLAKRLRAKNIQTFREYCAYVKSDEGVEERNNMLNALTTNVTRFFREPHHFDILKSTVLPPLLAQAKRGGRVRIWSSACSSGEEPYSIALTLLSLLPDAASYDIKVLATDIDKNILDRAQNGVYRTSNVEPVPTNLKQKYFDKVGRSGEELCVNDTVKKLITFRPLNLIKPWPVKGAFDFIFCRNVVIYFEEDTQQELWQKFYNVLSPGGWLFIGHSERVTGPAAAAFTSEGMTAYRDKAGGER